MYTIKLSEYSGSNDQAKARRASRFSEIAGGTIKRLGTRGGTPRNREEDAWSSFDGGQEARQETTASNRSLRSALDEYYGLVPKKRKTLQFATSFDRRQYQRIQRDAANSHWDNWHWWLREQELEAGEKTAGQWFEEQRFDRKSQSASRREPTRGDDNLNYSRHHRRMVFREVQVTRVTEKNGRTRIISDGTEKILCRRRR